MERSAELSRAGAIGCGNHWWWGVTTGCGVGNSGAGDATAERAAEKTHSSGNPSILGGTEYKRVRRYI
jgi:hypothetical protein